MGWCVITTTTLWPQQPCNSSSRCHHSLRRRRHHRSKTNVDAVTPSWRRHAAMLVSRPKPRIMVASHGSQQLPYSFDDDKGRHSSENPAAFHPSVWGDFFLEYSSPTTPLQLKLMEERAQILKEDVANLIASPSTGSLFQRVHLFYVLERLCLDYLFEEEINTVLAQIIDADVSDCDLHTVSLWFYLLRSHCHQVSADVFARFQDEEGIFTWHEPRDILSLYNAAHLRTHGETILYEAISFTRGCLNSMLPYLSQEGTFARDVTCALAIPIPRRVQIYDHKNYISIYEKDTMIDRKVLALAKLNSNVMQNYYQQELKVLTSWDQKAVQDLPDNLKLIFGKVFDNIEIIGHELEVQEKYRLSYFRTILKELVRAYNMEVKWRDEKYVPGTVDEHLQVSAISSSSHLLSCASFLGMGEIATTKSFDWVSSMPKMVHALCIILRLSDDLSESYEQATTFDVGSTIDSCMKEHNISVALAREKLKAQIEESWKDINEEWLKPDSAQPKELLERILNLARTMDFIYTGDVYNNNHAIKETINSLFVESFTNI